MNTRRMLNVKLRLGLAAFALLAVAATYADTTYIWTGNAGDSLWTTAGNWNLNSGYPTGAGTIVQFNGDATVTLDTGTATPIKLMKVTSGIVTINGTAGSHLKATYGTAGYDELFNIGADNDMNPNIRLILNVPVDAGGLRCDKWYGGAIVFRSVFTNTMNNASNYGFLFGSGSNALENACSFYMPNSLLGLGNGNPSSGTPQVLSISDGAQLAAYSIRYPLRSANTHEVVVVQDGDDTAVTLGHNIEIGATTVHSSYTSTLRPSYQLRGGRLAVGGNICCGLSGKGIGRFEMSGGTLELGGTVQRVDGGRFVYSGGTILASTDRTGLPIPDWAELNAAPVFGATAGKTLSINSWNLPHPIRTAGAGTFLIADNTTMTITNDVFVDEGTLKLGSHIHLDAPGGDYTPLKVKVASGATLRFTDLTSRLSRPLDLEIEEGGKVHFPQAGEGDGGIYMRSMLIAHRLKMGGETMGRGRYAPNAYFSGYAGASIVVPYVWTGAAGDGIWETPENWEGGAVPVGGDTGSIADLSRADGQTITITRDAGYCLGGIIANPNGRTRKVTLKGSTIMLQNTAQTGQHQFNCVLYVGEGCELVLDINYEQSSVAYPLASTALGGGTITFLKRYADVVGQRDGLAPINADATLVFAGTNMTCMGGSGVEQFVLGGSIELAGRGQAILEDGAKITAKRFHCGGCIMAEIIHRGATLVLDEFSMTRMNGSYPVHWQPFLYRFEKGSITCSRGFYQGVFLFSDEGLRRYEGGDFRMTGGTLTTPLIQTWAQKQYLNFYGGTINLGGGGMTLDTTRNLNGSGNTFISDPVHLGGVRLHATADSSSDVPLTLDGVNGDPEIDTDGHDMTFTGAVSGSGGFVKTGTGTTTFTGACSFGGTAQVQGGAVVFGEMSSLGACRITVTDGTLSLLGAVDPGLELAIPAATALTLPAEGTVTVKQLFIGGVRQAAGSYSIGGGTVTVAAASPEDAVWIGASGGNWSVAANWQGGNVPNGAEAAVDFGLSALASNATIRLDGNVTLKELSYSHPDEGAKLTIGAGGGTLTIASGATIAVERGRTLEIAADVVMGPRSDGSITVVGGGTVRFSGKLRPVAAVATLTTQQSAWIMMADGILDFAGEVEGVRPMIHGTGNIPRIVFSGNCVATNKFAPNLAWLSGGYRLTGEIVQESGTFGLDVLHPDFASTGFYLGNPANGEISYTLNNGMFRMNRTKPTCFNYNPGAWGHFMFTVNGGEVDFSNYEWGGRLSGDFERLTLNPDGTLRFRTGFGIPVGRGDVVLNGGRIESTFSGALVAASDRTTITLGGKVTFAQSAAADVVTIENALGGAGVVEQQGPGTLVLGRHSPGLASAIVTGGTLTFADEMPCTTCTVSPGATLNLDFDGTLELEGMMTNGRIVRHGYYGAGTGKPLPAGVTGTATLHVRHGSGGISISFK